MAKLTHYQEIIISVLTEYYQFLSRSTTIGATDVRDELITDTLHNHYQLLTLGWQKQRFFHQTNVHIDIINQKVWVQQNNTEFDIVAELMEKGIPMKDIVLGFIEPSLRAQTGFAAA